MSTTLAKARIGDVEVHPAADLFPDLEGEEFQTLVESVKERGVLNEIVLYQGTLVDGRSRLRACIEAGLPIEGISRRELAPDRDPYQFVWDQNVARRHLTPAQRAAIRIKVMEVSGELQRKREEFASAANEQRAAKARERHDVSKPWAGEPMGAGEEYDEIILEYIRRHPGTKPPDLIREFKISYNRAKKYLSEAASSTGPTRDPSPTAADGHPPGDGAPSVATEERTTPEPPARIAAEIAAGAGTSTRTAERVLKMKREAPDEFEELAAGKKPSRRKKRPASIGKKIWRSVPCDVGELASFLLRHLKDAEVRQLVAALTIERPGEMDESTDGGGDEEKDRDEDGHDEEDEP